jgi:translocation and assembly module TamB
MFRAFLRSLGVGLVFLLALGAGALLHINVPAARRLVLQCVNASLASAFAGRIVIERVGTLGTARVDRLDARVDDPDGHTVIRLFDVSARVSTFALVRSLLMRGPVVVEVSPITASRGEVNLDADPSGALRLAKAFAPAAPSSQQSARGVQVALGGVSMAHVSVSGQPTAGILIDADVDRVQASVIASPGAVAVHVPHAEVVTRGLPTGANASGTLDFHLVQPSAHGGDRALRAVWRGTLGEVAGTFDASYDAGEIDAVLDVPAATPENVRSLWRDSPLVDVASLHAEVRGKIPELSVRARAHVGRAEVDIAGPVILGDPTRASLSVDAHSVNAHALSATAPPSDLSASGTAILTYTAGGEGHGQVQLDLDAGTIGTVRVPPSNLRADVVRDAVSPNRIAAHATLSLHEPGAPTELSLSLTPLGSSFQVDFDATTDAPHLDAAPRLATAARGRARASARGTVDVGADRLDAHISGTAEDIDFANFGIRTANLAAHLAGRMDAPSIDATLDATGLEAGAIHFATARASAHGTLEHGLVEVILRGEDGHVHGTADVSVAHGGVVLGDVRVSVHDREERVVAHAPRISMSGSELDVDDLEIGGLGAPLRAQVHEHHGTIDVRAESSRLDVGRIARLARSDIPAAGLLSLDVDASLKADGAKGHLLLDLSGGALANWQDVTGHVDVTLDGRRGSGRVTADVGNVGSLDIHSSSIEFGAADVTKESTWTRAWGAVDFHVNVDLAQLEARLPSRALPLARVSGALALAGHVERDSAIDTTPDVDVNASTTGLTVAGTGEPSPWHIEGLDATARLQVDGDTGATTLAAQAADASGVLVTLGATSEAMLYDRLVTTEDLVATIATIPFEATVHVPQRDIATWPPALRTNGLRGLLEATVAWRGTMLAPTMDATASLRRGHTDVTLLALPVDLDLSARYDGSHAAAALVATARGHRVLETGAELDVRAGEVLDGFRGEPVPWIASAHAKLADFPLQSVGALYDRRIRGSATGQFELDRLHEDASATLALDIDQLSVGDVPCKAASVQASVNGHALSGSAHVEEADGSADARVIAGSHWGSAWTPTLDSSQPAEVSLTASHFRPELLRPFVENIFAQLDGRVDASARLLVDPGSGSVKAEGTIALEKGVVEFSSIGGEFHDVSANIGLAPDGVVRFGNVSARGLSGLLQGAATARFDGLVFGGARAQFRVPATEPIPLVVEGVQLGVVDGRLDVTATPSTDHSSLAVSVDAPSLHVELPLASAHAVQALGTIDGLRVKDRRNPDPDPAAASRAQDSSKSTPARARPVKIDVHLGEDVQVRRGTDVDVWLTGHPAVLLDDKVHASGQIRIQRGTLDVQGKPFTVDNGTVTFVGDDPANPQVKLTAMWTAPDATRIYADFVGPLKTGAVTLRSEPARAKNEILSLILFGTTDEQAPTNTGASQQASTAVGAAGGAATQPINSALGGVNQMLDKAGLAGGISTKIDTSQTTPRPEVEVQIARDISLQVAWVLGVPPPGSNPDSTLFTLNWRFLRKWSLQTTVGSAGTSILDLIWQHRY